MTTSQMCSMFAEPLSNRDTLRGSRASQKYANQNEYTQFILMKLMFLYLCPPPLHYSRLFLQLSSLYQRQFF